jgi:DNA-binding NarL/FixJ family response regulator
MGIRILLADDHAETRRATRRLLADRSEWVICGEADNGFDAVEKAATLKPDIVILDLSMPKMNGFEAAKIIHTAHPKLPLLLFSVVAADAQGLEEIRAAGFRGAVPKATSWLLPEAVGVLLQGKTFFCNHSGAVAGPVLGTEPTSAPAAKPEAVPKAGPAVSAEDPQNAKKAAAGADGTSKPPVA